MRTISKPWLTRDEFLPLAVLGPILVLAVLLAGCAGDSEDGITAQQEARLQPVPPVPVSADESPKGVQVSWRGTGADVFHYVIYRRAAEETAWLKLGTVRATTSNREEYGYEDTTVLSGARYIYGVSAIGQIYTLATPSPGPESPIQESDLVTLP